MEQPDKISLGVVKDFLEYLGAVAHLHHGHAGALVVGNLVPRPLQHLQGQHGRTGRKIVDALASHISSSFILPGSLRPGYPALHFIALAYYTHYMCSAPILSMPRRAKKAPLPRGALYILIRGKAFFTPRLFAAHRTPLFSAFSWR